MNEIFISYSRKDSDFVKKLVQDLKKSGIDPWIDVEDIKPAIQWQGEIKVAIQACHNFVFVISDNSCKSAYCNDELCHALMHDKRIIPIICQPTEFSIVPIALNELHCIKFEEYEQGLKTLLQALDNPLGVSIGSRLDSKIEILTGFRKSFYLYRNQYLIGRYPSGSIWDYGLIFVGDRKTSKNHLTLKRQQNRWHALDGFREGRNYQVSLNGVLLNGRKIEPGTLTPLANNDCIQLGETIMLYSELSPEPPVTRDVDDRDTMI